MFIKQLRSEIEQPLIKILGNFILLIITLILVFILYHLARILFPNADQIPVIQALLYVSDVGIVLFFIFKTIIDLLQLWRKKNG